MNPTQSKRLIVVGFIVLSLITLSSVWVAGLLFNPTSYGQNFLLQLLERNEDAALEYLTPEFRDVVRNNCPKSSVTECFWLQVEEVWGSVNGMQFVRRDPTGTTELFHLQWSALDVPLSIVLHTRQVDGSYLVDGWRGFVAGADTSVDDALVLGLREDNALVAPPAQE